MSESPVRTLLAEAVEGLGGSTREGQIQMAEAVGSALVDEQHLLVQAGTGTGKSLAYLVPSILHDNRVVVATATLALQHQLVERDLPRLMEALKHRRELDTSYAVLKGRSNYACLHRIREGVPDDNGTLSMDFQVGGMAAKVLELREWAEAASEAKDDGDKDSAPRHTEREWRQISVSARDCLGAAKCPFGEECFAERARDKASKSHLVITNHSLLAIDAIEGIPMIPEYDAVVIDEAHELVARVTQAATDELSAGDVERAARRARRHVNEGQAADDLADASDALQLAMMETAVGRIDALPGGLLDALAQVRDSARAALSAFPKQQSSDAGHDGQSGDAGAQQAKGMVQDVFTIAERMAAGAQSDVLWLSDGGERGGFRLYIAPLQVWGQLRDKLLTEKTVVFTSATLKLGGTFDGVASTLGLKPAEQIAAGEERERTEDVLPWRALDVGSPFDYSKQGILYVAKQLPQPGRDGLSAQALTEIVELIDAADGRALGLFSSRRAAEQAAEHVRSRLPHLTTLAQGEAQLAELQQQFVADPHTVLFGTLTLWQGLDVPGDTCQLVLIDRIPFPRPDDPLMSARQKAADKAGGNGFMQVAATHAALLLAQGAGRLIRTTSDRGVVAILDPRLATARYGTFLKASLPPMWPTTDPAIVRNALKRLASTG
ncbi:ATP-dependent DNA helicase [Nocardioides sp. Kera G14]|uniref:ATP-dependent DNA helicase n=1 Tax=Nocardioides sp. Kera G14 TaxID=2884264 RepID=UPI001D13061C|nr:ATP-dependent DNA helicase [Nocardioides sp. Kera G14]UDY24145.1 ATP-dependent DNA helicase [Nocardioides sp. Kera G14]